MPYKDHLLAIFKFLVNYFRNDFYQPGSSVCIPILRREFRSGSAAWQVNRERMRYVNLKLEKLLLALTSNLLFYFLVEKAKTYEELE